MLTLPFLQQAHLYCLHGQCQESWKLLEINTCHPLHGFMDLVTRTHTHDPSHGISHGLSQPVLFSSGVGDED